MSEGHHTGLPEGRQTCTGSPSSTGSGESAWAPCSVWRRQSFLHFREWRTLVDSSRSNWGSLRRGSSWTENTLWSWICSSLRIPGMVARRRAAPLLLWLVAFDHVSLSLTPTSVSYRENQGTVLVQGGVILGEYILVVGLGGTLSPSLPNKLSISPPTNAL